MFDFLSAFQPEFRLEGQSFFTKNLGDLVVPTGRLVACDPLVYPDSEPFTREVPPGRYPLLLSIARLDNDDERVAFAMLKLSDAPVVRYEPALVTGQDVALLRSGEYFGYGVDTGIGCFMDAETQSLLLAAMDALGADGNYYDVIAGEMNKTYQDTRQWVLHRPVSDDVRNVALFSSGYGDGSYSSWFGLDANGNAVTLVTDFLVADISLE
jgi:hypothetical protein